MAETQGVALYKDPSRSVEEFRQLTADKKWVVAPAAIEIQVGDHAEAALLKAPCKIAG